MGQGGSQEGRERIRVAEFFSGIGLMRLGLAEAGPFEVVWANDISASKAQLYRTNFPSDSHLVEGDIRKVKGRDVPDIDLATASFPCTDLSLAGTRGGLSGSESSMFFQFARVLHQMRDRRPPLVLLENVPGFATSRGGADLRKAIEKLNRLGYECDLVVLDAAWFVPQSRVRVFIIGKQPSHVAGVSESALLPSQTRPPWVTRFVQDNPDLKWSTRQLPAIHPTGSRLRSLVERRRALDWWSAERVAKFESELSPVQCQRLATLTAASGVAWRTAYRRMREGKPRWEIRADELSGCLRAARGGSSKQAIVEAGGGQFRVRWMTPREYARLQGAPHFEFGDASPGQLYFGFGDAVCVPAVAWLARTYLSTALLEAPTVRA